MTEEEDNSSGIAGIAAVTAPTLPKDATSYLRKTKKNISRPPPRIHLGATRSLSIVTGSTRAIITSTASDGVGVIAVNQDQ